MSGPFTGRSRPANPGEESGILFFVLHTDFPERSFTNPKNVFQEFSTVTAEYPSQASVTVALPRTFPDPVSVAVTVIVTGFAVEAGLSVNDQ